MLNFLDPAVMTEKTWNILLFLSMNPESAKEMFVGILLAYLAISVTLAKAHALGGTGSGSIVVGLLVTLIGLFGMIQAAVLCDMLLLPLMAIEYRVTGYYISIAVAVFLMLIPFTRTFFRTGYSTSVGAWVVAVIVGGGVLFGNDYYFSGNEKNAPTIKAVQEYTREVKEQIVGTVSNKTKPEADGEKAEAPQEETQSPKP